MSKDKIKKEDKDKYKDSKNISIQSDDEKETPIGGGGGVAKPKND